MPLDPRAARFLEMTAAAAAGQRARDIAGRRRAVQQLMGFARADRLCPPGDDIALEHAGRTVGARLYRPEGAVADPSGPVIAFIHGGGLVAGSLDTHDTIARALCAESCCTLVAVAYRLAPEHPFPAAIEDVSSALAALSRESGARAGATRTRAPHIALCAESGGAAPALAAATQTRLPLAAISLVCPALEFATPTRSREEFAQGYLIDAQTLADDLADYLPRACARTIRASPRCA